METKVVVIEDTSERLVVREHTKPWEWGGFRLRPDGVLYLLVWPFSLIWGRKKTVFDRPLQTVVRGGRQIAFSDIQSVDASQRTKTVSLDVQATQGYGGFFTLCDLSLALARGENFKIGTGWLDKDTRAVAERIAEVLRKPLIWLGEEQKPGEPASDATSE